MKTTYKLLFSLALTFASVIAPSLQGRAGGGSALAQSVGEAFYIYRNDGGFNAFFREEIDSIAYSCYDADSTLYDDAVMQVVYTKDSIYQIPLAAIDSVSFVQPETKYKTGVIQIGEGSNLEGYIVKSEGKYLYLLDSTPTSILPRTGDKLVTTDMTDMFPCGYAGKVIAVTRKDGCCVIECEDVELEEIFDSYSYTINLSSDETKPSLIRRAPIDKTVTIPKLSHSWSVGAGVSLFSVSNTVETSLKPSFHIKGTDIVDPVRGRLTNIRVTGNYTTGITYDFAFEVSPDPLEFPFPGGRNERPICPFISFFWDFGMFVGVSGSVSFSRTFTQKWVSYIDYQREGLKMPTITFDKPSLVGREASDARLALKGSLRGGWYGELGFKPWMLEKNSDLGGKLSGRLEVGLEAEMERGIDLRGLEEADKNTALYDFVDNYGDLTLPTLTISPYASVTATIKVGKWNETWTPWKGKIGSPFYQGGYFPHFSNVEYQRVSPAGSIKCKGELSRTCLFPFQIGFSVYDRDNHFVKTEYYTRSYSDPREFKNFEVTIEGLDADKEYKVYPCINVFNHPVLASPYALVKPCPVTLSDFKVTKSQHQQGGFSNDGLSYDYRFDASVTATLEADDLSQIADWGYVYLDPNGREKEISLRSFGTSYTDTRYAYFRNQKHSTCTLYGYVKYVGSDETVYGEPHDFELDYKGENCCPDDHHPHWIDLGLPSGTQWRCCNEGASTPEAYGGYYTFGQISTVPSLDQIKELCNCCSYQWTSVNGVSGGKFTGPNGGSIFLPAAGYRWDGVFYKVGSGGYYWSYTPDGEYSAWGLGFGSGIASWDSYFWFRGSERSVRPVR